MTAAIIVTFPLQEDKEPERFEFPTGTNLATALMSISPDRWGGLTFELYRGAVAPRGAVPIEDAASIEVAEGEVWHVAVYPAEPTTMTVIVASVAATLGTSTLVASIIVYAAITAINMAIAFGISMLMRPKQQSNAVAPSDQPTALNSLTTPKNTMRPLSRIPDIYGRMRHWPDLIMPGWSEWRVVDNSVDTSLWKEQKHTTAEQSVTAVYCIGRGTYSFEAFRFADSAIGTQQGTVIAYSPGQTLPGDIRMAWAVQNLSRLELGEVGQSNQWSPWFELPSDDVSEIWAQVGFPGGLMGNVAGKKVQAPSNTMPATVLISIEGERLDETGAVVETGAWNSYLQAQTTNELRQTFKTGLITPGHWRVRVANIEPIPPPFPNGNTETWNRRGYLEGIIGFSNLTEDDRTFETETVLVVGARNRGGAATQNLEAFNAIVTRVLPSIDWAAGSAAALLPASSIRDWNAAAINTLTDPTICGYTNSQIDWESIREVQAALWDYPEGFKEGEFNGLFDRQMSADAQLQAVASKARAIAFMSNGRITFARDQRRGAAVSAIFNRRNRLAERGSLGIGLRFPTADDNDGIQINWFDEANDYRQSTYSYPEGVSLVNPLVVDLAGATKAHEVCRRARYEWAVLRYRRRTQPLRVSEEAQLLLPYDRVGIVAPWDEGIIDGEVLEEDGAELRLDRPVPILPGTAAIRLRRSDGRETQLLLAANSARGPDWVELVSGLPTFPIVVPGSDRQLGTLYNLSREDAFDQATFWLVSGAEIDDRGVTMTLIEDSDEVFQLSDDLLDPCNEDACVDTLIPTSAMSEFIPLLVPDPGFPDDKVSPTFGTPRTVSSDGRWEPGGGLILTPEGLLGGAHWYWDWEAFPSVKFQGVPLWDTGEGSGSVFDGSEIWRNSDFESVSSLDTGGYWRFDSAGGYLKGPLYGLSPNNFNTPMGACRGATTYGFFTLMNPPSGVAELRHYNPNMAEDTGPFIPMTMGPVTVQTSGEMVNSGVDNRLVRSGNVLIVTLDRHVSSPGPGESSYPLSIYFYDLTLTQIGTVINVGDAGSPWMYNRLIATKEWGFGESVVMYTDEPNTGSGYYNPDMWVRTKRFRSDGTAIDEVSVPVFQLEAMNETNWWSVPKIWPLDFEFVGTGSLYLVVAEAHNTPNGDEFFYCVLKLSFWKRGDDGTWTLMSRTNLDPSPFSPPDQERVLDAKIIRTGTYTFEVAFQRYTSNTAKPNGGETPIYRRSFEISICEPEPE